MGWIIFAVIAIIAGFVIGSAVASYNDSKIATFIGGMIGIVLAIILVVCGCIASVPTGHTGIITTFGEVEAATLEAGLHGKAPWQSLITMDNRVQKQSTEFLCFSSDIQEVKCVYTVNYQISKMNASEIYKTIGKEYYNTVIQPNIVESVKTITARYTAEELIGKRDVLATEIETLLADSLEKYNIEVVSTAIEDLDFSDTFTDAVEAKQVAAQNKLKAQTEQEQKTMEAEQEAKRKQIEASAAAEVAKIQAQADLEVQKINADAAEYTGQKEAAKNSAINASLTGDLIKYYYIMQWDGKLPETMLGDSSSVLIDINK